MLKDDHPCCFGKKILFVPVVQHPPEIVPLLVTKGKFKVSALCIPLDLFLLWTLLYLQRAMLSYKVSHY